MILLWEINGMFLSLNIECHFAFSAIYNRPAVFKKGIPRIIDKYSSSGISNITKSIGIYTLAIETGTSSQMPIGIAIDLSAIL
jgi:hypothetical protein